jgi:adenylyltransferase/sulfurtransferase
MKHSPKTSASPAHRLVIVGAGNIGSQLCHLVARLPSVRSVLVADPDAYEEKNIWSQAISPADIGRPKAVVQARRMRRINPELQVEASVDRIENVPLGRLRADVILAGLDSKAARREVNRIAWRLGIPWIDGGVNASGLLARINVYRPGPAAVCLECAWDEKDYAALEAVRPCADPALKPRATNAPAALGALVASLAMLECEKILAGRWAQVLVGRQVVIDAASHRQFVTAFRRNPQCRFDHATWFVRQLDYRPDQLTLARALALGNHTAGLRVAGQPVVARMICRGCGRAKSVFRLKGRLRSSAPLCPACGEPLVVAGAHMLDPIRPAAVPAAVLQRSLARLGVLPGDVLTVGARRGDRHFELRGGEEPCPTKS